jgi:ATP-binding cassette, subfamily B, multidrug efflux pump
MTSATTTMNQATRRHARGYYLGWIVRQYQGQGRTLALMLALTVLSTAAAILLPMLFKALIDGLTGSLAAFQEGTKSLDEVAAERARGLLLLLALGFGPIIGAVYPWLRYRMNLWFEQQFRERYLRRVLGRETAFFQRFNTGDLVTRLAENVKSGPPGLPWLCCSGIFRALTSLGIIAACLLGMFSLHPWLTLAAVTPMPIMLFLFLRLQTTMEERCAEVQEHVSLTTSFLESAFSGIRILKSFTAEHPQRQMFQRLLADRSARELGQARTEGLFQVYFELLSYVGEVLVLVYGGMLVARGDLSLGAFYAFFSFLGMIVPTIPDIPMLLVTLSQAFVIIDRLEELEESPSMARAGDQASGATHAGPLPVPAHPGPFETLRFESVGYTYRTAGGSTFGLSNISFSIKAGEKIAVMGPIGSGKTTLLHLAAGLFSVDQGTISVNGVPLDRLEIRRWREQIGFVQQEPIILSESARENISFWRGLDLDQVHRSGELAQVHGEILALPRGYDELVGARGIRLSGGQRQRLSLARALAGNPQLLLMDDVTAGLDAENERLLWRRLRKAAPGLACLIVTHRAATARMADRIIVLSAGRVVATGTHDELLRSSLLYRELIGRRGAGPIA